MHHSLKHVQIVYFMSLILYHQSQIKKTQQEPAQGKKKREPILTGKSRTEYREMCPLAQVLLHFY